MKNFLYIILVSLLLSSCFDNIRNLNQSQEFVQGSEDIPLLVGMKKVEDESLAFGFDSDSGSIISSNYETDIAIYKVRKFYLKTLPQMGWKVSSNRSSKTKFSRDGENLKIEYEKDQDVNLVRFFISSSL